MGNSWKTGSSSATNAIPSSPAKPSIFDKLSDDIIIAIISFNIDHDGTNTMIRLTNVNQRLFTALNPNHTAVNMIWRQICLYKLPYTPSTLKVKRWDQFLKYKLFKINERRQKDEDYKFFSDADFNDSVIVNCEHDIEEMSKPHAFKGKVGANGLPAGFGWKYKCPVLSDQMENRSMDGTVRYCDVCNKNVYQVHDAKELQQRVENNECVSLQLYTGIHYAPHAFGEVESFAYTRNWYQFGQHRTEDPHRDKRKDRYYSVSPIKASSAHYYDYLY